MILLALVALISCDPRKNNNNNGGGTDVPDTPKVDARLAFVGDYALSFHADIFAQCDNQTIDALIPDTMPFDYDRADLHILLDPNNDNRVIVTGFYDCSGTVSGDQLLLDQIEDEKDLDLGDVLPDVDILAGVVIPLNYTMTHHAATIKDGKLEWVSEADGASEATIMNMTIRFTGRGVVYNTATKL